MPDIKQAMKNMVYHNCFCVAKNVFQHFLLSNQYRLFHLSY